MSGHLTDSEIRPIRATLDRFGIPVPIHLAKVDAIAVRATEVRQSVLSETEPTIDDLTVANVAKRIDARAAWAAMQPHRREAATAVESQAARDQRDAWTAAIPELHGLLAPRFADAALRFTTELEQLSGRTDIKANVAAGHGDTHQRAAEAVADLNALMVVRRMLHGRLSAVDAPFWKWTQIVTIPSLHTASLLDSVVRRGSSGLVDTAEGELTWWANLVQQPGVALQWHTPSEQAELHAELSVLERPAATL